MTSELAICALANAITLRRPKGTICHSDRGSQFRSGASLFARSRIMAFVALWAELAQLVTTLGWSPSTHFCKTMFWIQRSGNLKKNSQIAIVTRIEKTYHRGSGQANILHDYSFLQGFGGVSTKSFQAAKLPIYSSSIGDWDGTIFGSKTLKFAV